MKLSLLPILLFSAALSACTWAAKNPGVKKEITQDTLVYEKKTFNQRADDCGSKPDSACTAINITYPLFKNHPALNDTVTHRLLQLYTPEKGKPADSFEAMAKSFMDDYHSMKKNKDRVGNFFTYKASALVIRQDSDFVTMQINSYVYSGGAHGLTNISFINWDRQTNKNLTLDDILKPGMLPELTKVGEKIFRHNENLSDTASLARDYFFKDAKFSLAKNFLITPIGLRFLYNEYEIKPYAAGETELAIPYTQIRKLLKPNTVIAQYLK